MAYTYFGEKMSKEKTKDILLQLISQQAAENKMLRETTEHKFRWLLYPYAKMFNFPYWGRG
jgi:hypothetical protein